jgi:hypothetical protein
MGVVVDSPGDDPLPPSVLRAGEFQAFRSPRRALPCRDLFDRLTLVHAKPPGTLEELSPMLAPMRAVTSAVLALAAFDASVVSIASSPITTTHAVYSAFRVVNRKRSKYRHATEVTPPGGMHQELFRCVNFSLPPL